MNVELGHSCSIDRSAVTGYEHDRDAGPASIGARATIRAGTMVYYDIDTGEDSINGYDALVWEEKATIDDSLSENRTIVDDIGKK